jgi:hypothetical protein
MPYNESKSLSNDELYAVVAYILNLNGIRYDGRADAAKSENAEPGWIHDVFARKINNTDPIRTGINLKPPSEALGLEVTAHAARYRRRGDRVSAPDKAGAIQPVQVRSK